MCLCGLLVHLANPRYCVTEPQPQHIYVITFDLLVAHLGISEGLLLAVLFDTELKQKGNRWQAPKRLTGSSTSTATSVIGLHARTINATSATFVISVLLIISCG